MIVQYQIIEQPIFRKKVPQSNLGSLLLLQRIEEFIMDKVSVHKVKSTMVM
jgi:hypothetical protein